MSEPSPQRRTAVPGREPMASHHAGASTNRRQGPDRAGYQFLPLECPNCGFEGKAQIARLDRTFQCKQCKKSFYVALDGTVSGERPPDAVAIDPARLAVAEEPSWLEQTLGRLPAWARWVVTGAVLLALAYGAKLLLEPEKPLPGELEDRAALAARSFAHGDGRMLKRLAKSRTSSELAQWHDKNRPAEWNDLAPDEVQFEIVSLRQGLRRYEKGTPIMDARVTANIGPRGKPRQVLFLWQQTELGEWWLDGERMLKESKVTKKTAAAAEPIE